MFQGASNGYRDAVAHESVPASTSNFAVRVTAAASAEIFFQRGDIDPTIAAPVAAAGRAAGRDDPGQGAGSHAWRVGAEAVHPGDRAGGRRHAGARRGAALTTRLSRSATSAGAQRWRRRARRKAPSSYRTRAWPQPIHQHREGEPARSGTPCQMRRASETQRSPPGLLRGDVIEQWQRPGFDLVSGYDHHAHHARSDGRSLRGRSNRRTFGRRAPAPPDRPDRRSAPGSATCPRRRF